MEVMSVETTPPAPAKNAGPVSDAIRSRERGLSLLKRANRWLVGLAVLLAGALTGLTAHAFHSSTASARTTTSSPGSGQSSSSGASAPGLQSPASPPASSPAPAAASPAPAPAAPVVSGGS